MFQQGQTNIKCIEDFALKFYWLSGKINLPLERIRNFAKSNALYISLHIQAYCLFRAFSQEKLHKSQDGWGWKGPLKII